MNPSVMRSLGPFWPGAAQAADQSNGAEAAASEVDLRNWRRLNCFMARELLCWLDEPATKIFIPENFLALAIGNDDDPVIERAALAGRNPSAPAVAAAAALLSYEKSNSNRSRW
jgi:hypothetical protein